MDRIDIDKFSPSAPTVDDTDLVGRIRSAYKEACTTFSDYGSSQWAIYNQDKLWMHDLLTNGSVEDLALALRNPGSNNLFFGFDTIYEDRTKHLGAEPEVRVWEGQLIRGALAKLALTAGGTRVGNPEAPDHNPPEPLSAEGYCAAVADRLGFPLSFPNPYENEFGLQVGGQVASVRAVFALYQSFRSLSLSRLFGCHSIMEIGAGLGRSAYYCWTAGVRSYRIIDLPLANVAQAYFLGRTLGPENIRLYGEPSKSEAVEILPPRLLTERKFDLVVNVDSMTEMDRQAAIDYLNYARDCAKVLLSSNHEVNHFRVCDLLTEVMPETPVLRYPSPMRDGYMEEIAIVRSA